MLRPPRCRARRGESLQQLLRQLVAAGCSGAAPAAAAPPSIERAAAATQAAWHAAAAKQTHLQQQPGFSQLLRQLQEVHSRQHRAAASRSVQAWRSLATARHTTESSDVSTAAGRGGSSSSQLQPYQSAALASLLAQLQPPSQRALLQLPPSASIEPLILQVVSHFAASHTILILTSSSARAAALRRDLTPLLATHGGSSSSTGAAAAAAAACIVPGELLKPSHKLVVADLQALLAVAGAASQLADLKQHKQLLAIYEHGFLVQGPQAAAAAAGRRSDNHTAIGSLLAAEAQQRAAAQTILHQAGILGNTAAIADRGRLLVRLSSSGWQQQLLLAACSDQQQEAGLSDSSSSSIAGFRLLHPEALAAGLVRPAVTFQLPTATQLPAHVVAAADAAAVAADGVSTTSQQRQAALSELSALLLADAARTGAIAAAFTAASGPSGRGLVWAADAAHARQLALALNLQGLSSLAITEEQGPAEQAAVLDAFAPGGDRVLVASSACTGDLSTAVAAAQLSSSGISCVLMAAPTLDRQLYASRLALGLLLPVTAGSSSSSCTVIDLTDQVVGPESTSEAVAPVTCIDILGSSGGCSLLPLPHVLLPLLPPTAAGAAAASTAAPPSSSEQGGARAGSGASSRGGVPQPAAAAAYTPGITGDLIWTLCADGSWAIPIKKGRGLTKASLRVLWLTKTARGFVPQLEEGLGQMVALPGMRGSALPLQRARLTAEAWLKAAYPMEAGLREMGGEWRDRPMSEAQMVWCARHGLEYDPAWSRGVANVMIDKFTVEEMRQPITERQQFLLSHLSPFAPAVHTYGSSTVMQHKHAAETFLQALMQGHFSINTSSLRAGAAAADAAADAGSSSSGGQQQQGNGSGGSSGDAVLPSRRALVDDVTALFNTGLRPRYPWMLLHSGQQLLLDLMNGSYLWLVRRDALPSQDSGADASSVAAATGSAAAQPAKRRGRPPKKTSLKGALAAPQEWSSSGGEGAGGGGGRGSIAAALNLDAAALYELLLELPDGSKHPVAIPAAAAALIDGFEQQQQQEGDVGSAAAAAAGGTSSSRAKPLPLPLLAALDRAERVAAGLAAGASSAATAAAAAAASVAPPSAAFLSRGHVVRLAGMVGGWRVAPKTSEVHPTLPASARQLEQLRQAGLPTSKKYTALDAHRELLRVTKSRGLPEPPATPSQLARIRELALPLSEPAAARLTHAQAKALLMRHHLAAEAAEAARLAASDPRLSRAATKAHATRASAGGVQRENRGRKRYV